MNHEITYFRDLELTVANGRSGHALKDLFTSVILSVLVGARTVFLEDQWGDQRILNNIPFGGTELPFEAPIIHFKGEEQWDGVQWETLTAILQEIKAQERDSRFALRGALRVHLDQLHNWEMDGRVASGSFASCIKVLRSMFHYAGGGPENVIGIHARRSDVANPNNPHYFTMGRGKWSRAYYDRLVVQLRELHPDTPIVLFTEKEGSHDLDGLAVDEVVKGVHGDFVERFARMVNCRYFVPTSSSVSTWATYLSRNTIYLPAKKVKHLRHKTLLENWRQLAP